MEQWKPVVGYEGLYEVSDMGWVRSMAAHGIDCSINTVHRVRKGETYSMAQVAR